MQDAVRILADYWIRRGCLLAQPFNTEVGAGTMNPATILRVLGPEPWRVAYVEPSVRPDDSRYGENPNRLQTHTQYQVILKPDPGDPQEQYLGSLEALGIDLRAHDVRFVEDNWAQPAIGAWGLGWEVWLDGMEITQFTYFQQVGGLNLDPVAVELTYGMERILMAVQQVTHFKDIVYAPGISYGEAFGQAEYEMSRYYLDDADVPTNRSLFEAYTAEAQRLIDARLPVPAHGYLLKSSHAFNVLDSRGAISTTERARSFATMRRLAHDVCTLWVDRREELGFPLLRSEEHREATSGSDRQREALAGPDGPDGPDERVALPAEPQTLLLEIGVEELPPQVVRPTIVAVREALTVCLAATRLDHGRVTVEGTPRRIVATVQSVAAYEPDAERLVKGPKWAAAYDAAGEPTKALRGFLRGQRADLGDVVRADIGGHDHAAVARTQSGRPVLDVLSNVLAEVVGGLRAEKNMRWSDPVLSFSRPIRWLVALWGPAVVPVVVSELTAGRTTHLHRTDDPPQAQVPHADAHAGILERAGIVIDVAARRRRVVDGATRMAARVDGLVDVAGEAALVDEITHLVEQPTPILGDFDPRYLELPEQILITVMRKHQRYLPVRGTDGRLLPAFVSMANGPCDEALVAAGNASVLRARYEDATFFWRADLRVPPDRFRERLTQLTFEERLGSVAQRADRIAGITAWLADRVAVSGAGLDPDERRALVRAGALAKFDLATQMVVELSSLAGFMAREYALRSGETMAVAQALYDMEQPKTSSDSLPESVPGMLLALADRFDLLMSMFAIGAKPTGSSDQFGLRRAALGVIRILRSPAAMSGPLESVSIGSGLRAAAVMLGRQGIEVPDVAVRAAEGFVQGRFAQLLRDEGVPAGLVAAVLPGALTQTRPDAALGVLSGLVGDDDFRSLVEALVRIRRIVPEATEPAFDPALLTHPAETALIDAAGETQQRSADLAAFARHGSRLTASVRRFFDEVLVMDPDERVRAARLGMLSWVYSGAPAGVDWPALDLALGQTG
ncbi:MAG TPA: glycine--tRNA ligase [Dermatophilaceae bacterium]|nr:glycine--tRNA ligase [Dermatophilaceae bacterium]